MYTKLQKSCQRNQWLIESVSDRVTHWAVRWWLKNIWFKLRWTFFGMLTLTLFFNLWKFVKNIKYKKSKITKNEEYKSHECKNLLLYKMYLCKWQKVFVQIRLKHYYPKCRAFCARLARRGIWLLNRLGVKWAVFGGGAALSSSPLSWS